LRSEENPNLIPAPVNRLLNKMLGWLEALGGSRRPESKRSHLVGMYLSQANRSSDTARRRLGNQQREDGKFAQVRTRG